MTCSRIHSTKAWSAGQRTRGEPREYGQHDYHQGQAFPSHLGALGLRLEDAELRHLVLADRCDEKGVEDHPGRESASRAELWQDFAEGMGSTRTLDWHDPVAEVQQWVAHVQRVASAGLPEEAPAAFYAHPSEMARLAKEKTQHET